MALALSDWSSGNGPARYALLSPDLPAGLDERDTGARLRIDYSDEMQPKHRLQTAGRHRSGPGSRPRRAMKPEPAAARLVAVAAGGVISPRHSPSGGWTRSRR